jgi:hypothetical protein
MNNIQRLEERRKSTNETNETKFMFFIKNQINFE